MKKRSFLVAFLLILSVVTVSSAVGTDYHGWGLNPGLVVKTDSAISYYIWQRTEESGYDASYQFVIASRDVEEFTGWHTTCIGASWAQKIELPKPVPPPVVVVTPTPKPVAPIPPPPPKVIVPPPAKVQPVFPSVFFNVNKSNLDASQIKTLDGIGDYLAKNSDVKVLILGHSDSKGSQIANEKISEKRAKTVRSYLHDKFKIADERMAIKAYGADRPISPNDTEEGRRKNRRVEIMIVFFK